MPSFTDAKRLFSYSGATTIGQEIKQMSDNIMQDSWYNDIQTRTCYIYDYYHDNTKDKRTGYIPNEDSGKLKVDVKFIVTAYKSLSKDDPEFHIQFSPDDWNNKKCIPNYFYKDYEEKYDIQFPIGLYLDIPDDRGIYWKWMIVYSEVSNQFPKFGVIKCNYNFKWITDKKDVRYFRAMWGAQRAQNSYNSGIYSYDKTVKMENQSKFWLPWNQISSELYYNQRIIVSMLMEKPITYQISKVENTIPKGVNMFTLYQDEFNEHTDYVNLETGDMYADYYKQQVEPIEEEIHNGTIMLSCALNQIKINGGYKTITAKCLDENQNDITSMYNDYQWSYYIDNQNVEAHIVTLPQDDSNKIKIKFDETIDENYLDKVLVVECTTHNLLGKIELNILSL